MENQCNEVRNGTFESPSKKSVFSQSAPGIFTNVANHIDWIEAMVKENGGMATCSAVLKSPPTIGDKTSKISSKYPPKKSLYRIAYISLYVAFQDPRLSPPRPLALL